MMLRLTAFCMFCSGAASALDISVWATDGMDRVRRADAPRPWLEPRLTAARGEWEPLQVVARGLAADLEKIQVTASPLRGENAEIIPPPVVLREHYVTVSRSTELSPLPNGEYPDALVPPTFPVQSITGDGVVNQPFWLDVYVPPGTPAGDYTGSVKISAGDGEPKIMRYSLHVWDFELPQLPALKSSMFIVWRRIAQIHGFDREASSAPPRLQGILDDYYDMLASHRLSPHEVWAAYPDAAEPTSQHSYDHIESALKHHLIQRGAATVGLPLWETWPFNAPLGADRAAAMDYVVRYYRICEKLGCADRLYKIFGELDEPHDEDAYAKVKAWKQFFDEVNAVHKVRVPLLITVQPMNDSAALRAVADSADILTPHVSALWMDREGEGGPQLTLKHLQKGGQLWTYTALVQAPDEWKVAQGRPTRLTHGHPPVWLTDYPAIHHRLLAWLAPRYGVTGFSYWDTSHFPEEGFDPWYDAGTYPHTNGDVYNGDGFLIYPAHQATQGYEGPVASIRLKWLRECVDDYDYLALMMAAGEKQQVLQRAASFARGLCDWDDNLAALYAAREDIARHLEKLNQQKKDS